MIGDPRLARRVHHMTRELRDVAPRLQARASLETEERARLCELLYPVEHVKVNDSRHRQARSAGEPGELAGRVAVGIVGEEGMAVEIDGLAGRGQHHPAFGGQRVKR